MLKSSASEVDKRLGKFWAFLSWGPAYRSTASLHMMKDPPLDIESGLTQLGSVRMEMPDSVSYEWEWLKRWIRISYEKWYYWNTLKSIFDPLMDRLEIIVVPMVSEKFDLTAMKNH